MHLVSAAEGLTQTMPTALETNPDSSLLSGLALLSQKRKMMKVFMFLIESISYYYEMEELLD